MLMREVKVTGRFEQLLHAVFAALYHEFPEDYAGEHDPFLIRVSYLLLVRGFKRGFIQPFGERRVFGVCSVDLRRSVCEHGAGW